MRVQAVDATGAGDGFVAGLLVGLLERHLAEGKKLATAEESALEAVLTQANAVGALTVTQKGAIPALPTAAQLAQFRRQVGA